MQGGGSTLNPKPLVCDPGGSPRSSLASTSVDEEEESLLHSVHHRVTPAPAMQAAYGTGSEIIGSGPKLCGGSGAGSEVRPFQNKHLGNSSAQLAFSKRKRATP